jgi:cytidine deaminase
MRQDLYAAARAVRERAHAPYSGYFVGAALITEAGSVHAGCNVENAAFPEGWCAETSAIAQMVAVAAAGPGRKISEICVVADRIDGRLVTPCGGCRQRLAEFGNPETLVHASDADGNGKTYRLADLLPAAFALDSDR